MISVVIVNFNRKELLCECLDSVKRQDVRDLEVIVIDNGSSDGSAELVAAYPEVRLIQNPENVLFCKAYNQGIDASRGDFILCLNNDVCLEKNYLSEALFAIGLDERIGMVSGKILRPDKKTIDSTGLFLGRNRKAVERGYNKKDRGQYDDPGYVFGVSGACVFFRRAFLADVKDQYGYFDERFGAYYEDLDICWRGQRQGWKAYYEPKAVACHTRAATAIGDKKGRRGPNIFYLSDGLRKRYVRNRYLCMKKNDSLQGILVNLPFVLFYEIQQWCYVFFVKYLCRGRLYACPKM
ncbi:MAG: glycosyltransferase family 2 protein [Candidatus Omnitrophica bacterium]|nr:glycosyltransferase family 2 protein [Candidatus Omnitrophota bacterium]